jgi:all-trans-8'-apo-beta-carotenal 15,15'-oxygenase
VVAQTFCAHPHFVAARRAFYGFGMRFARRSSVDLYELPLHARARRLGSLPLEAPTILHDFIATERHLIFFLAPTRLLAPRAILGEIRPERLFDWRPQEGSEIVIVPIDEPERPQRIRTEAFLVWHFANAFECGKEIVVDFVRHPDASALGTMRELATRGGGAIDMNLGEAWRARLDPSRGRAQLERVSDLPCEFPSIDPRGAGGPRRFAWLTVTRDRQSGIARLDLESGQVATWLPGPGQHVSEPVVAPRPTGTDERDGWVLVLVCDERTRTSHVAILDAAAPEPGPTGRAWFDHPIPVSLHGTWVSAPGNVQVPVDPGPSRSSSGRT